MTYLFYFLIALYGIIAGSFLNVCIYRIPKKENMVTVRSHCMKCGYQLKWYDLIPLFSWLFLRGRCRNCHEKISVQYPVVEALNGILWVAVFYFNGMNPVSILYCLLASALLVISVIDWRTYEIPHGLNIFIFVLGAVRLGLDLEHWYNYVIGLFAVSLFFLILYWATKGRGIGGGDIYLMGAAGFLIGWKLIWLALIVGCIAGSVIHLIRMKASGAGHVLAMGPYLSAGILVSVLFGERMISWYLAFCIG